MKEREKGQPTAPRGKGRGVLFALFVLCAIAVTLCSIPDLLRFSDEKMGELFNATLPRLAVALFLLAVLLWGGYKEALVPPRESVLRGLFWAVPCMLVAFANFPYSALCSGSARIERVDLLWLFVLKCLSVALMEELFFRALLLSFVRERLKGKLSTGLTVLITAAIFGLSHLLNLFFGGGVGATFLQVGYTFLLGCMFATLFLHTGNLWLCVGVHFVFDVGGMIVTDLGSGPFQDTVFWVLTVLTAVICAAEVIITLILTMKRDAAAQKSAQTAGEEEN